MYPLHNNQQQLIEKYLLNDLTAIEQANFDQLLATNNEFAENALLERIIKDALAETSLDEQLLAAKNDPNLADFNALLADLDESQALQYQLNSWLSSDENMPGQSGYSTREEIEKQFAPAAEYERVLLSSQRASNTYHFEVLSPYNGIKCNNRVLEFKLRTSTEIIKLRIENNQKRALIKQNIEPNTTQFTLQLPIEQFPPGRYYWKLSKGDQIVIREFFIWD